MTTTELGFFVGVISILGGILSDDTLPGPYDSLGDDTVFAMWCDLRPAIGDFHSKTSFSDISLGSRRALADGELHRPPRPYTVKRCLLDEVFLRRREILTCLRIIVLNPQGLMLRRLPWSVSSGLLTRDRHLELFNLAKGSAKLLGSARRCLPS